MHLEVVENGGPVFAPIDELARNALERASRSWRVRLKLPEPPILLTRGERGDLEVRARGVAGFVRAGGVTLDILPKFLKDKEGVSRRHAAMWRFLAYARGLELLENTAALTAGKSQGLADLLADVFLNSVCRAGSLGYPVGYLKRREVSQFLRGRLDLSRLEEIAPYSGKLPVISARLTRNVAATQALKWSANRLARLVENSDRRKALLDFVSTLPDVGPANFEKLHTAATVRQFPHLSDALEICQMLLANRLGAFSEKGMGVSGFLWNSDNVFESAMKRLVAEALRPHGLVVEKRAHPLLRHSWSGLPRVSMTYPDIDISHRKASRLILDSKYKDLGVFPVSSDVYQVLAAGRVARTRVVGLVYPAEGDIVRVRSADPLGTGDPSALIAMEVGLHVFEKSSALKTAKKIIADALVPLADLRGREPELASDEAVGLGQL